MTIQEFAKFYNPDNRCEVTYVNDNGETVKGLALDCPKCSISMQYFVWVDSFSNKIRMRDVVSVRDTGSPWSAK